MAKSNSATLHFNIPIKLPLGTKPEDISISASVGPIQIHHNQPSPYEQEQKRIAEMQFLAEHQNVPVETARQQTPRRVSFPALNSNGERVDYNPITGEVSPIVSQEKFTKDQPHNWKEDGF